MWTADIFAFYSCSSLVHSPVPENGLMICGYAVCWIPKNLVVAVLEWSIFIAGIYHANPRPMCKLKFIL
jgi:hypothetical protein